MPLGAHLPRGSTVSKRERAAEARKVRREGRSPDSVRSSLSSYATPQKPERRGRKRSGLGASAKGLPLTSPPLHLPRRVTSAAKAILIKKSMKKRDTAGVLGSIRRHITQKKFPASILQVSRKSTSSGAVGEHERGKKNLPPRGLGHFYKRP